MTAPTLPRAGAHIWVAFKALHATRDEGMAGPKGISYLEIEAWEGKAGFPLRPWEVRALKMMDEAFLAFAEAENAKT